VGKPNPFRTGSFKPGMQTRLGNQNEPTNLQIYLKKTSMEEE